MWLFLIIKKIQAVICEFLLSFCTFGPSIFFLFSFLFFFSFCCESRILGFADFASGMLSGGGGAPVAVASMAAGGGGAAVVAATPAAEEKKVRISFPSFLFLPFFLNGQFCLSFELLYGIIHC